MSFWSRAVRVLSSRAAPQRKAAVPFLALHMQGRPVWSPRTFAAFARQGFAGNAVVYRAVRMIAEAAASVPVTLLAGGRALDRHPLLDLLACPHGHICGADLLEAWYGYLLLAGNAYLHAVSLDGAVRALHVLRPDRMTVAAGPDGWPDAYDYTAGGRTTRFRQTAAPGVRPILHMALFHPLDDHYGLSPVAAAAAAVDVHNAASVWNKALLDNAARPSGALIYRGPDGQLTEEQFARLKAELEQNYQGAVNAGRPLLLEGGLDWKTMALSPRDMDFVEIKHGAAREIALALGVPPMLLGIPGDNTYANFQEANRMFWRQTVLPLAGRTLNALAVWLGPAFGGDIVLKPDRDRIEALSAERAALWARIQAADFLTDDEKRAAVGLGRPGGGEGRGP